MDRLIYIQGKLDPPSSSAVIDAKISELIDTMNKVNIWYAEEWSRLNGGEPGRSPEQQNADDLERRKERHKRTADRNKENLKTRSKRYKDSPQ